MGTPIFPACKHMAGKGAARRCIRFDIEVEQTFCNGCRGDNGCKHLYQDGDLLKCKRFKWVVGDIRNEMKFKVCKHCREKMYHIDTSKKQKME